MNRLGCLCVTTLVVVLGTTAQAQTGIIFASDTYGSSESNPSIDPLYGSLHPSTRAISAKHHISYGVVDWTAATLEDKNSAGLAARLANWNTPNDNYESLGHWGAGYGRDYFRQTRGLVRYDADTFLSLGTNMGREANTNGVQPPQLVQLEYRDVSMTDDQWAFNGLDAYYQIRSACRPFGWAGVYYQWGPGPPQAGDPNAIVDWTWTGGGVTGALQIADSTVATSIYSWDGDDVTYPPVPYYTFDNDACVKMVDNTYGGMHTSGTLAQGTVYDAVRPDTNSGTGTFSPAIDVAVFYGESENMVFVTQYEGRVYKMVGGKELGYRRMAGQAMGEARVTGTSGTGPKLTPDTRHATDFDSGAPTVGAYPSDWTLGTPGPHGAGITDTVVLSDAMAGQRHYSGLAVDAGGRVYVASQRIMDNGIPVEEKFASAGADVWADYLGVGNHLLYDPNNAPFGTDVVENDTVLLLAGGGSTDTTKVYTITSIDNPSQAYLNSNPGDSLLAGDVTYVVYPAGVHPRAAAVKIDSRDQATSTASVAANVLTDTSQDFSATGVVAGDFIDIAWSDDPNNGWISGTYAVTTVAATTLTLDSADDMGTHPITDPNYTTSSDHGVPYSVFGLLSGLWTSEALVDVYSAFDGAWLYTININDLARPDGVVLGDPSNGYWQDGTDQGSQVISGVVIHGDLEIDPTLNSDDVTRLWLTCAGGDGDPDTNDGLDVLVIDVSIEADGTVAGADLLGGIDDNDMNPGTFYNGNYNVDRYMPFDLWVCASDVEFDGLGNLAYMGNRAPNDNRYTGFTADDVALAVANMATEAAANEDAIVGITGFSLDMNVYGLGTDFGIAFTNTPLSNPGSSVVAPGGDTCDAVLVSSDPAADGTLPKKANNCLFLTFDEAITVNAGETLSIVACNGGADVSASFTYSVEVDGVTLKVAENGEALTNQTWYRISEGSICVAPFTLDVCTLIGDADGNGQVLAGDLGKIWSKNAQIGPCFREDTDGNGQVLAGDLGLTWSHNAELPPAKVCP